MDRNDICEFGPCLNVVLVRRRRLVIFRSSISFVSLCFRGIGGFAIGIGVGISRDRDEFGCWCIGDSAEYERLVKFPALGDCSDCGPGVPGTRCLRGIDLPSLRTSTEETTRSD